MITEERLQQMTVEEFDSLNVMELATIRNQFPKEYKRLWRASILAASPFRRYKLRIK